MSRGWVYTSLLGAWLAAVMLVVPAGADEFSLTRCLATGSGTNSVRASHAQGIDIERHLACYEAQREYELRRQAKETAERERQRRAAAEVEARRQAEAQAKETADQAAKEKSRARQEAARARKAEGVERAREAREAKEIDAARRTEAQQETERARRAAAHQPGAEQFMPGACPTPDLMAKCTMSQDPVLEQIRKSQENAARGRPSR